MLISIIKNCSKGVLVLFILLCCTTIPVFSQNIMAYYGLGGQYLDENKIVENSCITDGLTMGVNILYIGDTGFTISFGVEIIAKMGDGMYFDPIFGLGYIHYNKYFIGGLFNFIPKQYIRYHTGSQDMFFSPTIVGGYDFGPILIGGQLSYMYGVLSSASGFDFSIIIGINIR